MSRFDDYLLWKSELSGRGVTGLGPERALLVSAAPFSGKPTRYSVVGQSSDFKLDVFRSFKVKGTSPVFLLNEAEQVEKERLLPSFDVLFSPRSPELSLRALVSSRAIVSFSLVPAIVGVAHRIPAVILSSDPQTLLLAGRLGIPCLKRASTDRLLAALTELFENHRWDVTFLSSQILVEKLGLAGLIPPKLLDETFPAAGLKRRTLALISDAEYLPHLNGLLHNLKEVGETSFDISVLALDEATERFVSEKSSDFSLTCHRFEDLWQGGDAPLRKSWSVRDRALRSKPRFLLKLVRAQQEAVLYLDCDIHFRSCPSALFQEFKGNALLLFPNWNDSPLETKRFGIFNAGMLGARPGSEKFLEVWSELCLNHYQPEGSQGYFVDQGFLDLVPLYIDNFTVYRRGDENVARWNQLTREDSAPIRSFHASQPDAKSFFEEKVAWDQALWLFSRSAPSVSERRWQKLLVNLWRPHVLSLSRWYMLAEAFEKWTGRKLPEKSGVVREMIFGRGRPLLKQIAWIRRRFANEHLAVRLNRPDTWISSQQLAIRASSIAVETLRPSALPLGMAESLTEALVDAPLENLRNPGPRPLSSLDIH